MGLGGSVLLRRGYAGAGENGSRIYCIGSKNNEVKSLYLQKRQKVCCTIDVKY